MAEGLENLKQAYAAFADGNLEGASENWSDEIKWEGSQADDLPGGGEHDGKEAVVENLKELVGAYESFSVVPDEWIDGGETVVVLGHEEAKLKEQGSVVKVPFVHIWRVDDDGQATRVQVLNDSAVLKVAHDDEAQAKEDREKEEQESQGSEDDEDSKDGEQGSGSGDEESKSSDDENGESSDDDESKSSDDSSADEKKGSDEDG